MHSNGSERERESSKIHFELTSLAQTQTLEEEEASNTTTMDTTERSTLLSDPLPLSSSDEERSVRLLGLRSLPKYLVRLSHVLSLKYLLFLGLTQLLICGVYAGLIGACFLPVFQKLGVDAATEQLLVLVCTLPYTASPLLGVISDLLPIAGLHKRYWMVLAIAVGALGCASLATTANLNDSPPAVLVVASLVFMNLELSVLNLLNEGRYSQIMRDHPDAAADIITFNQACAALGSLIAMSFVGPLSDAGHWKTLFQIALGLSLAPLLPVLWGWLPEERRAPQDLVKCGCCIALDCDRLEKQIKLVRVAMLVGIGGPLLAVVSAYLSRTIGIAVVALVLILILVLAYCTLSPLIASVVAYTIVTRASSPSLRSALQYFYTADSTCLPDGPHFSYTFYLTYNGIVGEIFMLTAIVLFQTYMSQWSYRSVLLTTLLLAAAGPLVDVCMIKRWNGALGIPDWLFFLLGSSMLESMTSMLHLLPFGAILGKVCPPGTETATFATVAGVSSFASIFSRLAGSAMMDWAGLKTTGEDCNFDALPLLIVGLAIVLPIAVGVPAIYLLIPNVLQSQGFEELEGNWERVEQEGQQDPTETQQHDSDTQNDIQTNNQLC